MSKRIAQGFTRYGGPDSRQKYMTRLGKELQAYKRTGNAEHLYNIANYAALEEHSPENKKFHFNSEVGTASDVRVSDRRDRSNFK